MAEIIDKLIGETPLEALEKLRLDKISRNEKCGDGYTWENIPMTYAGRLDPMAEGKLIILVGDECKQKEKYLGLDKEYEVEIVIGLETDTYDALGLVVGNGTAQVYPTRELLQRYVGRFEQPYPPYSSKTIDGKQLHELARRDELPEEMPKREVEIYSIQLLNKGTITTDNLLSRIIRNIDLVKGDFRQEEIEKCWVEKLTKNRSTISTIKILVKCSSGTYMRSLAHRIGVDLGVGAFALSIKRTEILQIFPPRPRAI